MAEKLFTGHAVLGFLFIYNNTYSSPLIQEISAENTNLKVCRINVDEEQELVELFKVMCNPTLVYMDNGVMKDQLIGFKDKNEIQKMFAS